MHRRLRTTPPGDLDIHALATFQPESPVVSFRADDVRAASLARGVSKAVGAALKASRRRREDVAKDMSDYLDEEVSKHMLDAYASESRADHTISVVRFVALISATKDRRLLQFVAAQFGWSVVDRKYLKVIEAAQLIEIRDAMTARIEAAQQEAREDGAL